MREPAMQLTMQQVASFCGVSTQTVTDWLNRGRLNSHAAGNEPRVDAAELVHFMDENCLAIPPDLVGKTVTDMTPASPSPVSSAQQASALFNPSALVMETDTSSYHALAGVLTGLGITPVRENRKDDFFQHALQSHPQLLALELGDHDEATLDLIRRVRQSDLGDVKILVVSNQMPSVLVKAKSAGADAIVTKPLDQAALKRTIKILLNLSSTS